MAPDKPLNHVLVVGGGTAGWLAACHLARVGNAADGGLQVTLVESPDIPTIGVGEGTVPLIRESLRNLGISETDFIRECDVTFKQGIRFVDWMKPRGSGENYYHHIFDLIPRSAPDPVPYWLLDSQGRSFVDSVSIQGRVCDAGLGPKLMTQPEYAGVSNYAYHLDAGKFADFLMRHATEKLGVKLLRANVTGVEKDPAGFIDGVQTDRAGYLQADLFVDCTGFRALLLGDAMKVGFVDKGHQLFADTALAVQVPYPSADTPIPCSTRSTAVDHGWIWDIGLTGRRGVGHVYSSAHSAHDEAETLLRRYVGDERGELAVRRIPMRIGHRERFWDKNCVAIGLSQGFVEPLEATGILVYDVTSQLLAELLPVVRDGLGPASGRFNAVVQNAWERVVDFIKLHYFISDREDTAFWKDNRDPASAPPSLVEQLEAWQQRVPNQYDFPGKFDIFNLDNYQYVLYGMHFPTEIGGAGHRFPHAAAARAAGEALNKRAEMALERLLPHRALIERIRTHGLQKI
ncbi:tryptophan halogenase family protein [Biformimicrobium ophioploci]|uniref:Tryptophan 7-halogenase n=1 Tax=Biformimicrobium ophioploci TaxID=3036711 RepID=A0ABQ6LWR0_9GAMM|nr:tryptophan halogenase family protein [Microbulbifer sp. NKW57]GMG86530.1 tryptophan 7-halogenase [Microbulbifer sp. NKW57]